MTKYEALKLALEALEPRPGMPCPEYESLTKCAITAIREALAQPEQEPVVTRFPMKLTCTKCGAVDDGFLDVESEAPPQRKPLTDEEIDKLPWEPHEGNPMTFAEGLRYFARAIEAAHGIKGEK